MVKLVWIKRVFAAALAAFSFGAAPALAQTYNPKDLPVINPEPDRNGVDLIFGTIATPSPFETGSPGSRNLRLKYFFNGRHITHTLSIYIDEKAYEAPPDEWGSRYVTLHLGGTAKQFECVGTAVCNQVYKPDGSSLSRNTADIYTYQNEKGVIYKFFSPKKWNDLSTYSLTAHVETITYPDGEKLTFSPLNSVSVNGATTRVTDTVASNLGYTLTVWTDATTIPNYNYQTTIPGYSWLALTGTPRSARLSRSGVEIVNVNTQQTISGANNVDMVISQQDILNRNYRIDLRANVFSSCSLYADYTYHKPVKVTSPSGVVTEITYNPPISNGAPVNSGGGNPFPVKSVIRGTNAWTYSWGTTNSVTDPSGGVRGFDTRGFQSALYSGPSGGCAYPPADRGVVDQSSDELSRSTAFTYDLHERPKKATLPESNGFEYEYDARGNITKITQLAKPGPGATNLIVYQAQFPASCGNLVTCNKPVWTKDANGNQTDFVYDSDHGGYSTVTLPPDVNGTRRVITFTYAPYNSGNGSLYRLVQTSACIMGTSCANTVNEERTVTSYWSGTFLPESIVRRSGDGSVSATTSYVYDVAGRPTQVTDPKGNVTYFRYDAAGRLVGKILPPASGAHQAERTSYNDDDQVTSVEKGTVTGATDAAWAAFSTIETFTNSYDSLGRKIKTTQSAGGTTYGVTQYSYDAEDRLECTAVRMNPAAFGSLPASACTLGTTGSQGPDRITKNVFDAAGQLVQIRKAVDVTGLEQAYVTYGYRDAATSTIKPGYTPNGKKEYIIDANGNAARLVYDSYDRQIEWRFPSKGAPPSSYDPSTPVTATATAGAVNDNDREEYRYDANGNRTWLKKRDGAVLEYQYDALDRLTHKRVPNPVSGPAAIVTANCHATTAYSIASNSNDVCYDYDLRGLQTSARLGWESGPGIANAYDGLGNIVSSTTNMGGVSRALGYQYDPSGNRTRVTHPDGIFFTYEYDGLNRPLKVRENGTTIVATMNWDVQGRRSGEERGAVGTVYGYDAISRPASITDDLAGTAADLTTSFGYNPASQIVSRTLSNDAYRFTNHRNTNLNYAVNGLNQYGSAGSDRFAYDANGNLTTNDVVDANGNLRPDLHLSYAYDAENRLISTSTGAGLVYDPVGRLYEVSKPTTGTTRFLYDGDQLTLEYDASGNVLRRYVHGTGQDDPLLWYEGATLADRRSLQINHQGTIISVADTGGNLIEVNSYDEYGIPSASNIGRFQYTGQAWIPELGMYHYKARIYSPTLGRFLQTDPVGYNDQVNLYAYVGSDPVNLRDPSGKCPVCLVPVIVEAAPYLLAAAGVALASKVVIDNTLTTDCAVVLCVNVPGRPNYEMDVCYASVCPISDGPHWISLQEGAETPDRTAGDPPRRDENGVPRPDPEAEGRPHTQLGVKDGRSGPYRQGREFDAEGNPVRDVDHTDHGRPADHPNPHEHQWVPNPTGGTPQHGPARPLPEIP